MGRDCAVIIKGHGVIVTGRNLEEACITAVQLERTAKMIMLAGGDVEPLSRDAIEKFNSIIGDAHREMQAKNLPVGVEWRYYEQLVRKGERWSKL
jgi:ribulose-5-phosphate 4-epimerase/fuculose-1-phosphate aldolase